MSPASPWPPAPMAPLPPAEPDEWPPIAVVLAGITAMVGLLPALIVWMIGLFWFLVFLFSALLLPLWENSDPDEVLLLPLQLQGGALAAGLPILMLLGVIRLLKRRDRKLLVAAYLPGTLITAWLACDHLVGEGTSGWMVLVLLGPAGAPVFASMPSVGRWIAGRPGASPTPA